MELKRHTEESHPKQVKKGKHPRGVRVEGRAKKEKNRIGFFSFVEVECSRNKKTRNATSRPATKWRGCEKWGVFYEGQTTRHKKLVCG